MNNDDTRNNADKNKSGGSTSSTIQWVLYVMGICIIGMMLYYDCESGLSIVEIVWILFRSMLAVHVGMSAAFLILGIFQLYAICRKKANKFVKVSFIVNIAIFILGWIILWIARYVAYKMGY